MDLLSEYPYAVGVSTEAEFKITKPRKTSGEASIHRRFTINSMGRRKVYPIITAEHAAAYNELLSPQNTPGEHSRGYEESLAVARALQPLWGDGYYGSWMSDEVGIEKDSAEKSEEEDGELEGRC